MAGPHGGRSLFDHPYLLLSLATFFWSTNIVLGRFVVGTIPPILLAQVRWGAAALILLPFVYHHLRRDWHAIRERFAIMIVLTLTGVTLFNALAYYALNYTEAISGLLVQSAAPLMIGLFSFIFFRDSLTTGQLAGIGLSLLGVTVIVSRGNLTDLFQLQFNQGDLWYLLAVVSYSIYAALLRLRPQVHMLSFLGFTIIAGAILQLPSTIVEWNLGFRLEPTATAFVVMAYIVVVPSILGYLFFNRGVDLIGANRAGPFFHLIPVFGSALAIAFLGERPAVYHGVGYALIICGIVIAQKWARPLVRPGGGGAR